MVAVVKMLGALDEQLFPWAAVVIFSFGTVLQLIRTGASWRKKEISQGGRLFRPHWILLSPSSSRHHSLSFFSWDNQEPEKWEHNRCLLV